MGAVYLTHQLSTDTPRALKIMLPQWVERAELRERFEREAKASGRIASEHVVKIVAFGVDAERGMPWMAMEYCPARLSRACLPKGEGCRTSMCLSCVDSCFKAWPQRIGPTSCTAI